MSLKPIPGFDFRTYLDSGLFSGIDGRFNPRGNQPFALCIYHDQSDTFWSQLSAGSLASPNWSRLDPLGLTNTAPLARGPFDSGADRPGGLLMGEWDFFESVLNQVIYGISTLSPQIHVFDQQTGLINTGDGGAFTNVGRDSILGVGAGTVGHWTEVAGGAQMVFFESFGKAYRFADVRLDGATRVNALTEVTIAGGLGVPILEVPLRYTASPASVYEATQVQGNSFDMDRLQFVPDGDHTVNEPKGRMFFWMTDSPNAVINGAVTKRYLKIVEFNPTGKAPAEGEINRVHWREILFSAINLTEGVPYSTPGGAGDLFFGNYDREAMYYHPPTDTIRCPCGGDSAPPTADLDAGGAIFTLSAALEELTVPTAENTPETARTVRFRAEAVGDLNERIAGVIVDWTLQRASTEGEILDTSTQPATNQVANGPVDSLTLVVELNDAALTLGVDYTFDDVDTITWIGAQSPPQTAGYTATYMHRTNPVAPAHGTLLTLQSDTGVDGVAEAVVEYADDADIVGTLDAISDTTTAT